MTAVVDHCTIPVSDGDAIGRYRAIAGRAAGRACETGGPKVVYAVALVNGALGIYDRDRDRDHIAVHAAEMAVENLLLVVARECGQDEATHVSEGDD